MIQDLNWTRCLQEKYLLRDILNCRFSFMWVSFQEFIFLEAVTIKYFIEFYSLFSSYCFAHWYLFFTCKRTSTISKSLEWNLFNLPMHVGGCLSQVPGVWQILCKWSPCKWYPVLQLNVIIAPTRWRPLANPVGATWPFACEGSSQVTVKFT